MISLKNIFVGIICLCFFTHCKKKEIIPTKEIACSYSDTNTHHPKFQAVDGLLKKYVRAGLPGISILVEDSNGAVADAAGIADIEQGVKFSPCHISKGASITKILIGALIMKLQEQGRININDPIDKYIDEDILRKINNARGRTIKELMNHTSGIYDLITSPEFYMEILNNPNKQWAAKELVKYIYNKPANQLGNPYNARYSNSNFLLLSMCVEAATGEKHEDLLRSEILNPLGMSDTYYQGKEQIPSSAAQGYFDLHNNGTIVNVSNIITGSGNGFTGIYSNIFDLRKFIRALLVDKTLLNQTSLNQMQEFVQEDENYYCGLAMIKKFTDKKYYGIGHTGKDLGYTANMFYFPQKGVTLIFFINYGTNGQSSLKQTYLNFENELVDLVLQ